MSDLRTLRQTGFNHSGTFNFVNADSHLSLDGDIPNVPGCYAFVTDDDECVYVGSGQVTVRGRVWDYRRPDKKTELAPRSQLWAELSRSRGRVRVFTLTTAAQTLPGGLICLPAAVALMIEAALITEIQPRFNSIGIRVANLSAARAQRRSEAARQAHMSRRAA
jgi:hypothetical protein